MKYLPVLQELFESDTVLFLLPGHFIAIFAGLRFGTRKKCGVAAAVSAVIYMCCELVSNISGNYLAQFLALFLGTAALGCFAGFLICFFVCLIKRDRK